MQENFLGSWKCSIKFWLVVTIFKIRRSEHFRSVDVIVLDWTSAKDKCCLLLYYYYNQSTHQQHCKLGGELNTMCLVQDAPTARQLQHLMVPSNRASDVPWRLSTLVTLILSQVSSCFYCCLCLHFSWLLMFPTSLSHPQNEYDC